MISKGLWKTEGGILFVLITKEVMKHLWEGVFYNMKGQKLSIGKWKDNGDYFMSDMPQYTLVERRRDGADKGGGWPNVP